MRTTASIHVLSSVADPARPAFGRIETETWTVPSRLTSFVGREQEIDTVSALLLLPEVRLLTLTGTAGVGKTRLAQEVAEFVSRQFDMGVLFVPLASISNPGLVRAAIGQGFGCSEGANVSLADRMSAILNGRSVLLLLDNFEHVLSAAPVVTEFLAKCPSLSVMVTSRAPLRVAGERQFAVHPLDLPGEGANSTTHDESSAVRLFHERIPDDTLNPSPGEGELIGSICRRLDGLPLAIELAAAQTRVLSLPELLARLDKSLELLADGPRDAPARLRSLHHAFAWSYSLLREEEQALLRALSIFEGGFTLAAAEFIGEHLDGVAVLPRLTALLDQSLIHRVDATGPSNRYSMLQTIREFGLAELTTRGEEVAARDRHLQWFASRIEPQSVESWVLFSSAQKLDFPRERDNLRSALDWSMQSGQIERALRVLLELSIYWSRDAQYGEAAAAYDRVLDGSYTLSPPDLARMSLQRAGVAYVTGDWEKARIYASRALEVFRELRLLIGVGRALQVMGSVGRWSGDELSVQYLEEAVGIGKSIGDAAFTSGALMHLGVTHQARGDPALAARILEEAVSWSEIAQTPSSLAVALLGWTAGFLGNMDEADRFAGEAEALTSVNPYPEATFVARRVRAHIALAKKDFQSAAEFLKEALQTVHHITLPFMEPFCLTALAAIADTQGDWRRSALLYGAAAKTWDRFQLAESTLRMYGSWDGCHVPTSEALASSDYRQAFEAGRDLSYAEVYALSMGVEVTVAPIGAGKTPLSNREIEVLHLIALMHTNQEVADQLFISKRTVDSHVLSILTKLGVETRRAAVSEAKLRGILADPPSRLPDRKV